MTLEAVACEREKLRRGLEIPICRSGMNVPEVGRQQRQCGRRALAGAVGVEQSVDGERVAQVMRPRPAMRRAWVQPGVRDDPLEREVDVAVAQPGAGGRGEHRRGRLGRDGPITASEIGLQSHDRAGVKRDLARLAELAVAHDQQFVGEIDVRTVQADRLADSHPAHREQPDQRAHRAATIRTLIGLLAVSGMRVGEAIRLNRPDIDLANELLIVRDSKFGKSREVALHPSAIMALQSYLARRDRPVPSEPTTAVFTSAAGTRLSYCNVHLAFKRIVAHAGLHPRSAHCRPRPHDLRHTFAVNTLLDAYRTSESPAATLPLLSTYLGHVHPGSTYWYLQAAPELLALASDRLERHLQGASR